MNGEPIEPLDPSSRRYQLTDQLGWHELSVTYRARDLQTGTWVAFRRLKPDVPLGSSEMRRFEREFELLSSLRHPAVVRALDYGWDEQGPYYSTEYLEGRELITAAPLHWRSACANLRRIASALSLLHTRGILHGRLSPSRVLVTSGGAWKLSELSSSLPIGATATLAGAYGAPEASTSCLDERADVYSLGALAYFVLTGEHVAAPRRAPNQLAAASSIVHEVPSALDALIRAMVHVDRDVRPASMAEVIARLSAIAQLEPEPSAIASRIAESYLVSPPLHGQARALSALTAALSAAENGQGTTLRVEGDGARRLIDEVVRLARFGNWEVLRPGSLDARDAAGSPHESAVRSSTARVPDGLGPRLAARAQRPLLIVLEALQHASPEQLEACRQLSAQVEGARALLLLRAGSAALPATTLSVEPLTGEQTASLVRGMFGDIPRAELVARWLHEAAAGNAARVVSLARELVDDGTARFLDVGWSLPTRRPPQRARALGHVTYPEGALRQAACALALLRASPTVELAGSLLAELKLEQAGSALLAARVTLEDGGVLRLASPELRSALRQDPGSRALHLQLAEAWLAQRPHAWCKVEAAWHLLQAGESERGATLLARTAASDPLMHAARPSAPFGEVFAAALRACPARAKNARLALLSGLAHAALYEDPRWYREHAGEALRTSERATGLGLAQRLRPLCGGSLALLVGLLSGALRYWLTPRPQRVTSLKGSYELALSTPLALLGVAASCLDLEGAQQIARTLEPLRVLKRRRSVRTMFRLSEGLKLSLSDSPARALAALTEVLDELASPRPCNTLSPGQRLQVAACAHAACGLLAVHGLRLDLAERCADYLERTQLPCFTASALSLRQLICAQRGDLAGAQAARRAFERALPGPADNWTSSPFAQASLALPAFSCGDLVQLRGLSESLQSLTSELPSLVSYQRVIGKAALVAEQALSDGLSDPQRALKLMSLAQYEAPVFEGRMLLGSGRVHGTLAWLLNCAGRHREAIQLCAAPLARMEPGDEDFPAFFLELELQHALALSGLGEERDAMAVLDRLLARVQGSQHPLVLARVHEVRALVALSWSRGANFQRELAFAERWCRKMANTSSLARIEQLAVRAGETRYELAALPPVPPARAQVGA